MREFADIELNAPVHGDPTAVVDLCTSVTRVDRDAFAPGAVLIGIDGGGNWASNPVPDTDVLLTVAEDPPAPWIPVRLDLNAVVEQLRRVCAEHAYAASMLAQTLRIGEQLSFLDALTVESFAYSALLGGQDFRGWCARRSVRSHQRTDGACLRIERVGDRIIIVLSRSETHNAIDAAMRDELTESLNAVLDDPSVEALELRAEGRAFSVGGALGEFGGLSDTAMGHAIRTLRAPARLLHQLAPRATAFVHGACIGSGIEIAAAAGRIVASRNAWFQLPEISMGLIPGAGGTVTVPRRIGRHRALYWALTGKRLNARDAQSWGLVDVIAEP